MKKLTFLLAVLISATTFAQVNYKLPVIPDIPASYSLVVLENGTLPAFQNNTAYLLREGVTFVGDININADNVYITTIPVGSTNKATILGSVMISNNNIVLNNLNLFKEGTAAWQQNLRIANDDVTGTTIAYCNIKGLNGSFGLPFYNMKGTGTNTTLFNNEWSYAANDGIYGGAGANLTIVRNYFHHQNMDGVDRIDASGDAIQLEYTNYDNAYIAGNYLDRSHSFWKFALIINAEMATTENVVCEWNTFIGPKPSERGGATVRWLGGTKNKFTKNLIISEPGIAAIASYNEQANQGDGYGVFDNHFKGHNSAYGFSLQPTNIVVSTSTYGSDINKLNFWGTYADSSVVIEPPVVEPPVIEPTDTVYITTIPEFNLIQEKFYIEVNGVIDSTTGSVNYANAVEKAINIKLKNPTYKVNIVGGKTRIE